MAYFYSICGPLRFLGSDHEGIKGGENLTDKDFIKRTNQRLERRSKLKGKNKEGPAARKREGPPREAETKRFLKPTKKELKTQEGKIFLKFAESYPPVDLTLNDAEAIWAFIVFLKENGYHVIDGRTVFCFPFDRLVKVKDLK